MPRRSVDLVRDIIEAARRGDWETALAGYDDDAILDQTRMPDGAVYRGREGVAEFYRSWFGAWDELSIETQQLIDAGDQVVDINVVSGRGRDSGARVPMKTANVWTIENGNVIRQVGYLQPAEAL